jgi:hypothetical protein
MASTRAQKDPVDKPHTPSRGAPAAVPDDEKPNGHDLADEAGPLQTEFGTKEAAESMVSKKFKGD